ncbi:hypothetical protein [Streptomyces sp. NPDC058308]|uniref:hypothetical protein n=1 Tax=Streptomyces sp. NPDC058308 TaxID=3346440 RepID=UPI0036E3BBB7
MIRNVVGSVLALIGATAAVWSPFRAWYDGRHGRDFRIEELFSGGGITGAGAELFGSLFLPFAFAALLTLVGLVLRSRLLVALAGVLVLGFTVLWMVRQGQAEGGLAVAGDGSGLGQGLLGSLGGGVLLLLGAALMSGRARRGSRARGRGRREPEVMEPAATGPASGAYADPEPYPYGAQEPPPYPYETQDPRPYQDQPPYHQPPTAPPTSDTDTATGADAEADTASWPQTPPPSAPPSTPPSWPKPPER